MTWEVNIMMNDQIAISAKFFSYLLQAQDYF